MLPRALGRQSWSAERKIKLLSKRQARRDGILQRHRRIAGDANAQEDPMLRCFYQVSLAACLMAAAIAPSAAQQRQVHPATLIDIDALTAESDFTGFMGKGVPEDVRRNALRRLWVLLQLPVSCDDLCYEPEPAPSGFARLASEKLPPATQ
jgi:uncharacterized protein DUF3306